MQMKKRLLSRRFGLVAIAVTMLVAAGVVTAARSERLAEAPTSARDTLAAVTASRPELPVLVPERWHDDWAAFDVGGSFGARAGEVLTAIYRITPNDALRHPSLALCVVAPDAEEVLATESGDEPNSVDIVRICAATVNSADGVESADVVETASVGSLRAVLLRMGIQPVPATWLIIPLTADWRRVSWLDAELHAHG